MITVCTVTLNRLEDFINIFYKSIVESTSNVNEVIVINVELDKSNNKEWTVDGINFRLIGGKHNIFKNDTAASRCAQHAFGLHQGVEMATNDYVLISDPDIFFYTKIDEFYISLMNNHNLNFIGISRPEALSHSITYFPSIMNLFTKKQYLPSKEFLSDFDLGLKYFYPDCPDEYKHLFPNPGGHCETGCNLLIWAKEKNYNWLSFQTPDCHNYYTKYYRTNCKLNKKLPNTKILYHESLSAGPHNKIVPFSNAYKNFKEDGK